MKSRSISILPRILFEEQETNITNIATNESNNNKTDDDIFDLVLFFILIILSLIYFYFGDILNLSLGILIRICSLLEVPG